MVDERKRIRIMLEDNDTINLSAMAISSGENDKINLISQVSGVMFKDSVTTPYPQVPM